MLLWNWKLWIFEGQRVYYLKVWKEPKNSDCWTLDGDFLLILERNHTKTCMFPHVAVKEWACENRTGGANRGFWCAGEKNQTACGRQTPRLATDPGKMIRLNKDKHGIICYKSNQSCAPTQRRDLDPHPNKLDIL